MSDGRWNKTRPLNFFHHLNIRYSYFWFESSGLLWLLRTSLLKKKRKETMGTGGGAITWLHSLLHYHKGHHRGTPSAPREGEIQLEDSHSAHFTHLGDPRLYFRYSMVSNLYDQLNDQCLSLEIMLSWKCLYFTAVSLLPASQMELGKQLFESCFSLMIHLYPKNHNCK